ncbi:AlwI family type II restriction endonuclease [Sulfurospirillum multivorans]|uniref:Type IIs restriction endonuclease n=2 Tax=Sulfurospirillum multivorans TaxID=66821 RepID=A0AA86AR79_SULMK|nr:AlwI family type II restriction endonuclease [Sulfurospirillum multivorans]AHJ14362.1 putative type IIs restriction endonuclease [Sulfurospirillum multivorans DSM 12446]QEH07847.1 putative type IIs restriction endonuclease [Sulfurospirillum multivorans]
MTLWFFGNTTVRSPFRLRDGLIAIYKAQLQGHLRGKNEEMRFNEILAEFGIVDTKSDVTYSIGRKWRAALTQHGFLYPKLNKKDQDNFLSELGATDTITPNGFRLMRAETVSGWQECFLRSMAAYIVPSDIEPKKEISKYFSPLRLVLEIMLELEKKVGDSKVNFIEIASIIQCRVPTDGIQNIVGEIISLRTARNDSIRKKHFDRLIYDNLAEKYNKKPDTFSAYADANLRYLKATGLFYSKGRGIALSDEKHVLIIKLVADNFKYTYDLAYLKNLTNGAKLPLDNHDDAMDVLNDLIGKLRQRGEFIDVSQEKLDTPSDIAIIRHTIEDKLFKFHEIDYAKSQASQIDEILIYLDLFSKNKVKHEREDGSSIEIPSSEKPAYLEWIIWRSFLAINSLTNMPWEARGFKVDQDFLPIGTASGGAPDMVFEFEDMVIVVEVTLTTSSRQEAAEGEPVRRHVAKYAESFDGTDKKVFGLFIAINIDTNTANTFRLGEWYLKDDKKIGLLIVPVELNDFKLLLTAYRSNIAQVKDILRPLMMECRVEINNDAPKWKKAISTIINNQIKFYNHANPRI